MKAVRASFSFVSSWITIDSVLIVIEGVDATGKTTLSYEILKSIGTSWNYVHFGPPGPDAFREYAEAIYNVKLKDNAVFDRLHWGEMVYGPMFRGSSSVTDEQFYWLELLIQSRGGTVILCVDDPNDILHRVKALKDNFVYHKVDHLREIQQRFIRVSEKAVDKVLLHSISNPVKPDEVATIAIDKSYRVAPHIKASQGHYIGPHNPRVLLVGDVMGDPTDDLKLPFIPDREASGHFLMGALLKTKMKTNVGITNSIYETIDLLEVQQSLGGPTVIALGNDASDRLTALGVPHGKAYHPQYARRFKFLQQDEYAAALFAASLGIDTTKGGWFK